MISVIAWDANFRESLHTIDFFAQQNLDKSEYEFLWVDFYNSNERVRDKVSQFGNIHLITLDHKDDQTWHLGKCINEGVAKAKGDLLVIPDGDIAVEEDFLERVRASHEKLKNLVTYHKRYDEPQEVACEKSKTSISHLKSYTKLMNPTNYAGCLALSGDLFSRINGYETHDAFAGPGINGMETYIRLRNAGSLIKWEPEIRIYHPWHPSSGSAGHDSLEILKKNKLAHPWINPYAGLEQSWITHRREMTGETVASEAQCEEILKIMPRIGVKQSNSKRGNFFLIENFLSLIRK